MGQQILRTVIVLSGKVDNTFGIVGESLITLGNEIDTISQKIIGFGKESTKEFVEYDDIMREVQALGEYDTKTMRALDDLVHQGKILYYGVSEWSPVQITKALGIIKDLRLYPMTVLQPQYNMVDRYIEDEIFDISKENGLGIVPFSPLAQGLLTGKYRKGQPIPEGSRATHQADKQINNLLTDHNLDLVEQLSKVADGLGIPLSVMALAWTLRDKVISSVITGATKPSQLESNVLAGDYELPQDAIDEIEKILAYKPFRRKVG